MLVFYLSLLETDSDRLLFTQIYDLYERKMYAAAKRILHSPEKAEDALHDAFLKVIYNFEKCRTIREDELKNWLLTVVKNTAIDMQRKDKRSINFDDLSEPELLAADDTAEDSVSYQDLVDRIRALPNHYREILELKLVLEWSDKQIAETLGINSSTVRSRIMRGKALLRKNIGPQDH